MMKHSRIIFSQKKTCNGCKALKHGLCRLGVSVRRVKGSVERLPTAPCYKPATIHDFFRVRNHMRDSEWGTDVP